jgi:hypothetical protein
LLCQSIRETQLVQHLGASRIEGDGASILVLCGLGLFLDDFDSMRGGEAAGELVGCYKALKDVRSKRDDVI